MGKMNIIRKERILTKSRMMEYFTLDGLVKMTGIEEENLDIYVLKELTDNALDGCELENRPPAVSVEIESDLFNDPEDLEDCTIHFTVTDEGPGMSEEAINEILNFDRFGGTKYFVKKPTRGAQGNALMTILGIPVVLANAYGYKKPLPPIKITSHGKTHFLKLKLNNILEKIEIEHTTEPMPSNGTKVELTMPWNPWLKPIRFEKIISSFAMWNPHARIEYQCNGHKKVFERSTDKINKYSRGGFGSVHWYTIDDFENLLYANIRFLEERKKKETVIKFSKNFKGGSTNQKAFTQTVAKNLPKYINQIQNKKDSKRLFLALKESTSPPKPGIIGSIGKEHFFNIINRYEVVEKLFKYKKIAAFFAGTDIPFCMEFASGAIEKLEKRQVFFGINNTITYHLPFERDLFFPSKVNERDNPWQQLTGIPETLSAYETYSTDPVIVIMHMIAPNIRYENYGKSTFETGGIRD